MHKHLQLVREFHQQYGVAQAEFSESVHLADMDVVRRQALLLACGSETCNAIAEGDLLKILAGLIDLAYNAVAAIACRGDDIASVSANWRQDGSVLTVVRQLSDKINACTSGETVHYSGLYALCEQLTRGFVNADFDQAFRLVHQHLIGQTSGSGSAHLPDLSVALYE
ncbi:hypothetical protein KEF85_02170 [Methylomonas paludis]|uniref:Uncharacterized protein n=1 Tax=Methylomonas paludis TaxID=1173101 RepID=A0A975MPW1_9GAMM|nr:hypothetical protein [Methylomonas paludis]QWF71321.1 hypothetical protein KEF85_02170 [Methylomonas paludis]